MDTRNRRRQFGEGPCYCLKPLIRIWGVLTAIGKHVLEEIWDPITQHTEHEINIKHE